MDLMKLITHDYEDISELSDEELKMLITDIIDIDEVPFAIDELYKRNVDLAMDIAVNILEQNLGDVYLQAAVIDIISEQNKKYMIKYINKNLETMDPYIYASVLDFLIEESDQPFGEGLSAQFLRHFLSKYGTYDEKQKKEIGDKYDLFTKSYAGKL